MMRPASQKRVAKAAPFLRWAGSKKQSLSALSGYWKDSFERYVEPFAGSACLFFHLAPRRALLGDINRELIQTYRQVRDSHPEVSGWLNSMPLGKASYYAVRGQNPGSLAPAQRAARFIYLNRFCFNGLYRTNLRGDFNVPYGGAKSGRLCTEEGLSAAAGLLRHASLTAGDFEETVMQAKRGDFVYMDPPFSIGRVRVFKEYDRSPFSGQDLARVRGVMERLADSKIAFVVSYLESEEAAILSRGFCALTVTVRRNIAGFLGSRRTCREILISYMP